MKIRRAGLADLPVIREMLYYAARWRPAGESEDHEAWVRLFTPDRPGYGFIDQETPELSMAVVPDQRRSGVGSALLTALVRAIGGAGYRAVSLSVEVDNPARRLYERFGFQKVAEVEGSRTIRLDLEIEQ